MEARTPHPGVTLPAVGHKTRLLRLREVSLHLASAHDFNTVLAAALTGCRAISDAACVACFHTASLTPDQQTGTERGLGPGASHLRVVWSHLLSAAAANIGPVIGSDDLLHDPRFTVPDSSHRAGIEDPPIRSLIAAPLRSRKGKVEGVLVCGHPEKAYFPEDAQDSLATLAVQVQLGLESIALRERLQQEVANAESARAQQQATERRLSQALDSTQQGTWIWDASTGLIDLDERAALLFGVPPFTPVSRSEIWERMILEDDRAESPKDLQQLLDVGLPYSAEYRIHMPDGSLHWICANGTPTRDDTKKHNSGMIGTVQDITMRKKQEESLRQSEKLAATGRLAATIAHEINNPLEAVTNLIYLAKTDPTTPDPVQKLLEVADNELARVSQIAQQTLGFYRDTTDPVTIDMNNLLTAVVDLFGRKLAIKQLQVDLDLDPDLSIVGLQGEIRQVVSNLLVNAIDASTNTGSHIRIRGRHRHRNGCKGVCVLISDQGSGIPIHVQSRLFTPFVTTKQSRGTGLGLWVTRGMIEKHGGTVRFRSRTKSPAGTVFGLFLPQTKPMEAFASPSTAIIQ